VHPLVIRVRKPDRDVVVGEALKDAKVDLVELLTGPPCATICALASARCRELLTMQSIRSRRSRRATFAIAILPAWDSGTSRRP